MQANKELVQDIKANIIPIRNENIKSEVISENKIEYHFRVKKEFNTGVYEFNEDCFWAVGKISGLFKYFLNARELENIKGRVGGRERVYGIDPIINMHSELLGVNKEVQLEVHELKKRADSVLADFERLRYCLEGIAIFGTVDSKDINEDKRIASLMIEGLDMLIFDIKMNISDLTDVGDCVSVDSEYIKKQQYIFQYRLKLSTDVMPVLNKYCSQFVNSYVAQEYVPSVSVS